jgi:hypothetical protein
MRWKVRLVRAVPQVHSALVLKSAVRLLRGTPTAKICCPCGNCAGNGFVEVISPLYLKASVFCILFTFTPYPLRILTMTIGEVTRRDMYNAVEQHALHFPGKARR